MPLDEHPDAKEDQAQIDANLQQLISELTPVLEHLLQQSQMLRDRVDALDDTLNNKLIGGLGKVKRGNDLSALKGKYGDQFKDLLDYKQKVHGADPEGFFEQLLDQLQGGGVEDEGGHISSLLEKMNAEREGHKALLMGKPEAVMKVEAAGEPEAVKEAAEQVPETVEKAVEEKKDEAPAVGSPEYFKRYKGKKTSSKGPK
jgi:hypothetical protein